MSNMEGSSASDLSPEIDPYLAQVLDPLSRAQLEAALVCGPDESPEVVASRLRRIDEDIVAMLNQTD